MTTYTDVVNENEQVVAVREIVAGEETVFYAIRDVYLGYWRTTQPLHEHDAWTYERRERAEFDNRLDAVRELRAMWEWRREQDHDILDDLAWETEAA